MRAVLENSVIVPDAGREMEQVMLAVNITLNAVVA